MIAVTNSSKVISLYIRNKNDDRYILSIHRFNMHQNVSIGLMKHSMNVNLVY